MRSQRLYRPRPVEESPLRLEECPLPDPGPGQIRVRVRMCGVCRTDLHIVEGDMTAARYPITPGHQVVGGV